MSISFEIFRSGQKLTDFTPVGAVAMGPESVPVQAEVRFDNGLLLVHREDDNGPLGLGLMWETGPLGCFFMETTRLVPREKPYNLNVELARFRLMKIVQKQEDWNLFDFPRAERFGIKFREAQAIFADALGKLDQPEEASRLGDQALTLATELSEELGVFHGDLLLQRRRNLGALVKHVVGTRIDPTVKNERYRETLATGFDYAIVPMNWRNIEPEEHRFDTAALDDWLELLGRRRVPVIAGPIIQIDEAHLPDWMFIWEHDFESIRELAYEFVQKIVQRYRKAVSMWNVCAGLHTNSAFGLSFEQIIELTRLLVSQVKALIPNTRTLVTITQPFGEYHAQSNPSVPPMLYAEMVAQAGINFEAFGLELEMGVPSAGRFTRDLFQLSCLLDRFSTLGRPLFITAVCAPSRGDGSSPQDSCTGGRWHRPWDPALQAEWLEAVYNLALSKPFVESIAWGNLADINPTLPGGGLLDDVLRPKPAFTKLQELRERYHSWHGRKGT